MNFLRKIINFLIGTFRVNKTRKPKSDLFMPCRSLPYRNPMEHYDSEKYKDHQPDATAWIVSGRNQDDSCHIQWFWSQEPQIDIEVQEAIKAAEKDAETLEKKILNLDANATEGTLK